MTNYKNLQEFIEVLKQNNELLIINEEVSADLEITEIADRMSKSKDGGKALLFTNVKGSKFPVLINAYGSYKRLKLALGDYKNIQGRIVGFINLAPKNTVSKKIKFLWDGLSLLNVFPKKVKRAASQEVVVTGDDVDLSILPVLKCWPEDGGKFITLPLVITKSLETGGQNIGMYRLQIFDKNTTGMHWHIHKDGAHFFSEYKKQKKRMPVAVAIGSDPALTYVATAPLPMGIDETLFAGFIRNKPVNLVRAKTCDLMVPADAEFILEGFVDPEELRLEGPFGDHTGYYSLVDMYPVFHVTTITYRKNPIYFTTIVGKPPMEDCYLAKATEQIFLPLLKTQLPEVVDIFLPWEGVFHNCVVVSIDKTYPGQAKKVMSLLWGIGQMAFAKMIMVVNKDVNVQNEQEIIMVFLENVDLIEDIIFSEGILDVLDHSAPKPLQGSKLGIDATGKKRDKKNVIKYLHVLKESSYQRLKFIENILNQAEGVNLYVLLDKEIDLNDHRTVLWRIFNNVDPKRDIIFKSEKVFVDATKKLKSEGHIREWPNDIEMTNDIKEMVNKKFGSLFSAF